jgi:hypothetical protein
LGNSNAVLCSPNKALFKIKVKMSDLNKKPTILKLIHGAKLPADKEQHARIKYDGEDAESSNSATVGGASLSKSSIGFGWR